MRTVNSLQLTNSSLSINIFQHEPVLKHDFLRYCMRTRANVMLIPLFAELWKLSSQYDDERISIYSCIADSSVVHHYVIRIGETRYNSNTCNGIPSSSGDRRGRRGGGSGSSPYAAFFLLPGRQRWPGKDCSEVDRCPSCREESG